MKSLTLAFASMGNRLESLITHLKTLEIPEYVEVVITVQKPELAADTLYSQKHFKVVKLDTLGLSKNRNASIEHANSDYVWFLDDDIQFSNQDLTDALAIINNNNADFYRVQVGCIEWPEKTFKTYQPLSKISKLHLLKISSIEIIANLALIKEKQLRFNERIGLGTDYKACEENNFLIDAWEQGASFSFIDKVLIRHTCIFDDRILANEGIFEIRGATASRYRLAGIALLLRWSMRYLVKEKKKSLVLSLIKGFCKGYRSYR